MIFVLAWCAVVIAVTVGFVRVVEDSNEKMRQLEEQRRSDEDDYFHEIWLDHPDCDKRGYEAISFDGWWHEREAPRLPPAEVKPRVYR